MQTTTYVTVKTILTGTLKGMTIEEELSYFTEPGTIVKSNPYCGPGYRVDACYPKALIA